MLWKLENEPNPTFLIITNIRHVYSLCPIQLYFFSLFCVHPNGVEISVSTFVQFVSIGALCKNVRSQPMNGYKSIVSMRKDTFVEQLMQSSSASAVYEVVFRLICVLFHSIASSQVELIVILPSSIVSTFFLSPKIRVFMSH